MAKKNKNKKQVDNRKRVDLKAQMVEVETGVKDGIYVFTGPQTISDFALSIGKGAADIIKIFFMTGKMLNVNSILNEEQIGELCMQFELDFQVEKEVSEENLLENLEINDDESELKDRPPVVTIMGHVDHGKTTLLDTIRNANVTAGEAGGITQHIGSYQVIKKGKKITFIDTPGHEAFSEMRSRGANVTDIVIIVVASDDGVMPQTVEAIDHAKAAGVPIIVFINKMDKPAANPERVKGELAERNLTPEEWGGDTIFIEGSAIQKTGIDELLENIIILAEVEEYKANPNRLAMGTIIESHLDKGFGPVATVLVQNGTLLKKDSIIVGSTYGRIRTMIDANGKTLASAGPSTPVRISGLESVPKAGDKFLVLHDEKQVKDVAQARKAKERLMEKAEQSSWKDALKEGDKVLNIIIKSDVQGSIEAIKSTLAKIDVNGATVNIIRSAVGGITESDVLLATTSKAIIYGFNIRPMAAVRGVADLKGVEIRTHQIIYKLKEEIENILSGLLDPVFEEEIIGSATVRATWEHSDVGTILGCYVDSGKMLRNADCRVLREGVVVYTGKITSLKNVKDDAREIIEGRECGLTISKFKDVKIEDVIEAYKMVEVK